MHASNVCCQVKYQKQQDKCPSAPLPCKLSSGRTNCVPPFIEIGGNGKGNKDPKPFLGSKGTLSTHKHSSKSLADVLGQEAKLQSQSENEICPSGSLGLLSPKRPSVHRQICFQHDWGGNIKSQHSERDTKLSNHCNTSKTPTIQIENNKESPFEMSSISRYRFEANALCPNEALFTRTFGGFVDVANSHHILFLLFQVIAFGIGCKILQVPFIEKSSPKVAKSFTVSNFRYLPS